MDDFKWFAIMMIGIVFGFAAMAFAGGGDSEKTKQYKACIEHHSVKECEKVR